MAERSVGSSSRPVPLLPAARLPPRREQKLGRALGRARAVDDGPALDEQVARHLNRRNGRLSRAAVHSGSASEKLF